MENLIEFKNNIIAWYPISKENSVLQIGKDDEILNELKRKSDKVDVAVDETEINKNYDYIVLIGTLDNLNSYEILNLLKNVKEHLTENGKILIAMKNKFGIKYFAGEKINNSLNPFESIVKSNGLSLNKIKEILNNLSLKYKFYYPLPDYEFTNVIFTDENLPNKDSIDARDLTLVKENELIMFSEREAYKQIVEQNKKDFPFFANSYFIEVSNNENFEDIKYVSFGNTRKKEFRIKTVMRENAVYKTSNNDIASNHIKDIERNINILKTCNIDCLDSFENGIIESKYLKNAVSYDEILIREYKQNGREALISKIKDFKEKIIDKLQVIENPEKTVFDKYEIKLAEGVKEKLHFTKNGIIDLIFQNCLIDENKIYAYDQEWYEENVPLEFILFRTILYFSELKEFEDVSKIYETLGLNEFLQVFEELERKIQDQIVDEILWDMHKKSIESFAGFSNVIENYKHEIEEANKHAKELEEVVEKYKSQIEELNSRILEKDKQLENYANELRAIANSLSWKITKPIRSISGALHRKK